VRIKFPLLVSGKLIIKGPGHVEIGRKCLVLENVFKGLTIVTADKNSRVKIGNNCMLAGLTVHCRKYVEIGNNVMTARSLIQDSLFLNRDEALTKQTVHNLEDQSIYIGDNVWIGGHCIVLSGSNIGADSVISAYSVCSNDVVKDFSLITGNPVRKPLPIDQLLKLRNVK
jgi:acetyltransferase-like isoleucine patch superfamily enzyme